MYSTISIALNFKKRNRERIIAIASPYLSMLGQRAWLAQWNMPVVPISLLKCINIYFEISISHQKVIKSGANGMVGLCFMIQVLCQHRPSITSISRSIDKPQIMVSSGPAFTLLTLVLSYQDQMTCFLHANGLTVKGGEKIGIQMATLAIRNTFLVNIRHHFRFLWRSQLPDTPT